MSWLVRESTDQTLDPWNQGSWPSQYVSSRLNEGQPRPEGVFYKRVRVGASTAATVERLARRGFTSRVAVLSTALAVLKVLDNRQGEESSPSSNLATGAASIRELAVHDGDSFQSFGWSRPDDKGLTRSVTLPGFLVEEVLELASRRQSSVAELMSDAVAAFDAVDRATRRGEQIVIMTDRDIVPLFERRPSAIQFENLRRDGQQQKRRQTPGDQARGLA